MSSRSHLIVLLIFQASKIKGGFGVDFLRICVMKNDAFGECYFYKQEKSYKFTCIIILLGEYKKNTFCENEF